MENETKNEETKPVGRPSGQAEEILLGLTREAQVLKIEAGLRKQVLNRAKIRGVKVKSFEVPGGFTLWVEGETLQEVEEREATEKLKEPVKSAGAASPIALEIDQALYETAYVKGFAFGYEHGQKHRTGINSGNLYTGAFLKGVEDGAFLTQEKNEESKVPAAPAEPQA